MNGNIQSRDISKEEWREYVYDDETSFLINDPLELCITETGSHRVIDNNGVCHYPKRGWVGIRWYQEGGFDF